MTKPILCALLAAAACHAAPPGAPSPAEWVRTNSSAPTWELRNGRWLSGAAFEQRTWYAVQGILRRERPARVDSVLDLQGRYIIPPFGDAHNHMLGSPGSLDPFRAQYLAEGSFYIQVLGERKTASDKIRSQFNTPCTLDVAWAHGPLTATLGHGFENAESKAMGLFDLKAALRTRETDLKASRLAENDAYWFIDSVADLDRKWPAIVAGRPDILKIVLTFSSDSAERAPWADSTWYVHGLRPGLVPEIVRRAHAAGLRVAAHVDTAHDFEVAARAGADVLAHSVGYGIPPGHEADFRISDAVARLVAQHDAVVIPTAAVEADFRASPDSAGLTRDLTVQRENLRLLTKYGVRIAVGPDMYGWTARREVDALRRLAVWNDRTLLRMWYETTPRSIYPGRKIGRLAEGYEASFLALARNPLEDLGAVDSIAVRMKQGCVLP
jgi:imidazolonepropionase-like amidohydrolase